jgi:hypothetical protein
MGKIKSNLSIEEIQAAVDGLCKANIQEIDFNDIIRLCTQLGFIYYDKGKDRKRGSAESFSHPILKGIPGYNGFVSIHLKHGGGSTRKVYKSNFVKYLAPGIRIVIDKQLAKNNPK